MAKLKKAPGRLIGRWKQEAIAANAGASERLESAVGAIAEALERAIGKNRVR